MAIISVKNVSISFDQVNLFEKLSFEIMPGEKVAIIGESGKGKSTVLSLLLGFIPAKSGRIEIDGLELNKLNIREIRKKIAWLPQEISAKFQSVEEMFFAPFQFANNKKNEPTRSQVLAVLQLFNLEEKILGQMPFQISGGQKQRIALAACLLQKKKILILDEPSSALDNKNREKITDYILAQKDLTVIASVHDDYWINKSDKVIELA